MKIESRNLQKINEIFQRLMRIKMGLLGFILILFFTFISLSAPLLSPHDPYKFGTRDEVLRPPNSEHPLGTDDVARDVWSQLLYGSRVSMIIGLVSAAISTLIGATIGLISGYSGGSIDELIMRIVDIIMVIPGLPIMIVLAAILGPSIWNIMIVIGVLGWTGTSRIVRSQVLSIKERPYVEAARCIGASFPAIVFFEVLPNVVPIIFAQTMMGISNAIYSEATLSFLGLGDPTHLSWGMMLHFAFQSGNMSTAWWWVIPPGVTIALLVLGFTFFGSALNEALNPRYRER